VRFLGMVSHELRTPLTAIKGFATTLLAEDVTWDPDSQRDFIETISRESDKLTELIDHLLDLSRLETGSLRIVLEKESLPAIVEAALPTLRQLVQEHELVVSLADNLPPILADGQRVAQVLNNLVNNAGKYSPAGTRVAVAAHRHGGHIQVDVSDEGPGIPAEKRAQVFEPFYRLQGKPGERVRGAGLGLAICKGLVEAHGGAIWVQDQQSPGTTVSFTLPIIDVSDHTVE
jgi:two-component system sensor histidine kinase KdpD